MYVQADQFATIRTMVGGQCCERHLNDALVLPCVLDNLALFPIRGLLVDKICLWIVNCAYLLLRNPSRLVHHPQLFA